jgi:hypothetical protein
MRREDQIPAITDIIPRMTDRINLPSINIRERLAFIRIPKDHNFGSQNSVSKYLTLEY